MNNAPQRHLTEAMSPVIVQRVACEWNIKVVFSEVLPLRAVGYKTYEIVDSQ